MPLPFVIALLVLPPEQTDNVATVSLHQCFSALDMTAERLALQEDIEKTDTEARRRLAVVTAAEAAIRDDSAELQKTAAKLLRAEFELYRIREQDRIRKVEAKMLNRALSRVEAAVATVARKKACSVVLYQRGDERPSAPMFTSKQIAQAAPRSLVLAQPKRIDLTDDVIVLLAADPK